MTERLPMCRAETLRECLNDHTALISAFVWDNTPEGAEFWDEQFETGLTDQGRAILQEMLAAAEAVESAVAEVAA